MNPSKAHHQLNGDKASIYAPKVMAQVPRLMSLLDREAYSLSCGSFDREHWSWKFRDFPITMMQVGIHPLALLWSFPFPENAYYQNRNVLNWIDLAIRATLRRQRRNGAFDSVAPNTQDHGVTLAIVYALTETMRLVGDQLPSSLSEGVASTVKKACQFALRSTEDYAFISNHQALFALAYLNAAELLASRSLAESAREIVDSILQHQSSDGWYREYEGPDPGYESLCVLYLASYWKRTGSATLLESLRRSVDFLAHFVHPDGSIGGVYGSRASSLYFPAGFEMLAGDIPMAASIAVFMRDRLRSLNVLTPSASDSENLPCLLHAYLLADLAATNRADAEIFPLPCQAFRGIKFFSESRITVAASETYYAVVNASKGGVCRIFDKRTKRIAYEDAGYLVRTARATLTSQIIGLGHTVENPDRNVLTCSTTFAEVPQVLPTPAKFILLRLLNLTLFRSRKLGAWVRRKVIARLILRKQRAPLTLDRTIEFGADSVRMRDVIRTSGQIDIKSISLPRSFTPIHMGSAKYFQLSELEPLSEQVTDHMIARLKTKRIADAERRLAFPIADDNNVARLDTSDAAQVMHKEATT